jgi:hypothetical protein
MHVFGWWQQQEGNIEHLLPNISDEQMNWCHGNWITYNPWRQGTTDRGYNPGDGQDGDRGLSYAPGSGEETSIRDIAGILEEGDSTVPAGAK